MRCGKARERLFSLSRISIMAKLPYIRRWEASACVWNRTRLRRRCPLSGVCQWPAILVKSECKAAIDPGKRAMGILSVFKGGSLRSLKSIRHKGKRLTELLEAHHRFVSGDETGARADLQGADLSRANFEGVNLALVNLAGANL